MLGLVCPARQRERWNKGLPYAARGDNEDEIRIVEGWCVVKRGPIDQRGRAKTLPGLPLQDTRLDSFASDLLRTASNPPPHPRLRFYLQGGWNHPNSFIHSHRVRKKERGRKSKFSSWSEDEEDFYPTFEFVVDRRINWYLFLICCCYYYFFFIMQSLSLIINNKYVYG